MTTTVTRGTGAAGPASGPAGPVSVRLLARVLAVGGAVGLLAAFTLAVEKVALLKDPSYEPSCSINPVLSCGSVMKTWQAEVFGFPNPFLGIAGFAVVTAVGVVLLTGAVLPRWFWLGLQTGVVLGAVFVHWLIFQSLYRIDALCPYCMVVWTVTMPVFWYTTLHVLGRAGPSLPGPVRALTRTATAYHGVFLTAWYLLVVALIAQRFQLYWSSLL